MTASRTILEAQQLDLRTWLVERRASIFREHMSDGEIQYTVRAFDMGRTSPFVTRSFATLESARSFVAKLKEGTDR